MNFIKRNKEHFIAPAVVLAVLCVIFAVKHVYPFGSGNVSYYDMTVSYIPLYSHTHDVLHGAAPAMFDWYNGAGADFTMNCCTYLLNPMNLFFLFVSRSSLSNAMTFFLMIKLMLCSVTMSVYLKRVRRTEKLSNVALSLFYAMCGHNIQYYMNIFFLDIVILFPLLMLALDHMLKTSKPLWYTVMSASLLIINYYLSAMVYIFIILYCFSYFIFIEKDPKQRRRISAQLGLFTAVAFVISAFIIIPTLLKMTSSPRTDYISKNLTEMLTTRNGDFDPQKQFMLFGTELGIAALLFDVFLAKKRKQKISRETWRGIFLMAILIVPIISEGSNLLWHMGSYAHFPYRFGFIIAFVSADIFASFNSRLDDKKPIAAPKSPKAEKAVRYSSIFTKAAAFIILIVMCILIVGSAITDLDTYSIYLFSLIASVVSALLAFAVFNRKQLGYYITVSVVVQSLLGGYGMLAPGNSYELDKIVSEFRNGIDLEDNNLSRVKQLHYSIFPNYGILTGTPTLGDWTLNVSREYFDEFHNLGYTQEYTTLYDTGGTAFTDALLNVKKIFLNAETDSSLYSYSQELNGFNFYDCEYTLPFGILTGEDFTEVSFNENDLPFGYQNRLYKALTGDNDDLIRTVKYKDAIISDESEMVTNIMFPFTYTAEFQITEPSVMYFYEDNQLDILMQINVNGEPAYLPYGDDVENNTFPRVNESGTAFVGDFDAGTVTVSIISETEASDTFYVGFMSISRLRTLCDMYSSGSHAKDVRASASKLSMKVNDPQGRYVFIPVEYSSSWRAEVNGRKTDIKPVMDGAFMAVKLGSEDADIELSFVPFPMFIGIVISAVGVIILVLILLMIKKGHDPAKSKLFGNAAYWCFTAVGTGLFLLLNIACIIGYIASYFT